MVSWVIFVSCLVLLTLTGVLMRCCLLVVTVDSESMMPTLRPGDRVLMLRRWPGIQLHKGQIVVFWLSDAQSRVSTSRPYIKRIVGLGGETLTEAMLKIEGIDERELYSNLEEPQKERQWNIPEKHIFVCGDNRDASSDSRAWGPVPEQNVLGVMVMKLSRKAYAAPPPLSTQDLPTVGLSLGQQAPPFTAQTLTGKPVTLATYRGQSVLFLFFAPADHCRNAIAMCTMLAPQIAARGVTIVCISGAMLRSTRRFAKEIQLHLPILVAPRSRNTFLSDYHIVATPAFCLLDEQGKIQSVGYLSMKDELWKTLFESWTRRESGLSKGSF